MPVQSNKSLQAAIKTMNENRDILICKYQVRVANLEWNINNGNYSDEQIQKLNLDINKYEEFIHDLKSN